MGQSTVIGTSTQFGQDNLLVNAALYRKHKRIMDAGSTYETIDDAIVALRAVWDAMESQSEIGAGYTPDAILGFGSDNAAVIAESILGRRNTVGSTRKALANMGK